MAADPKLDIPILTDALERATTTHRAGIPERVAPAERIVPDDIVEQTLINDREMTIAELQTQIAAAMFALTDEIMRKTFAEMEATIFQQISGRLRRELPELIDALLREHLDDRSEY
jgi:hypothetical protein